ncbi:MAG TPA: serine/threonine-protein kinase, partial [Chroococcales cyanobacterium]
EYIVGQDLRQLVKQNGPQPVDSVLDWCRQIASILEYLHGLEPPLIHRDLTPDNLVLRNDGSVVLIDFGASNQFVGAATGTLVGKQSYIAPEQLRGKATLQSDIYAFGATVYFLLTGRDPVPLSACHPRSVLPEISERIDQFVASMSAPDASSRLKSAADVSEKLSELISTELIALR